MISKLLWVKKLSFFFYCCVKSKVLLYIIILIKWNFNHRVLFSYDQGSKLYVFPCNRWLARDEDDKEIVRELVPEKIIKETIRKDGEVEKKELKVKDKLKSEWNKSESLHVLQWISLGFTAFDQDQRVELLYIEFEANYFSVFQFRSFCN